MKDIVISASRIARESLIFGGCVLAALLVNIYSIIRFNTEWKELVTTLPITLAVALVLFISLALLRTIVYVGSRCARRRKA